MSPHRRWGPHTGPIAGAGNEPIPVTLFGGELKDADAYMAAGVDRVLFSVRPQGAAQMTRIVDQIALHLGARLRQRKSA